jgi:menaquinone-dependent protoporphyrinogen oxidase
VRVLIAYASKMGGTRGLAEMLGGELARLGHEADVRPASRVESITDYDAVIAGGALYVWRWHTDARRFVKRFQTSLRERPVWLFSSGPLDESAREGEIPPVRFVRKAMDRTGARGHMTFGGRLTDESRGLPVGDWRDPDQVRKWAEHIDQTLIGSALHRSAQS